MTQSIYEFLERRENKQVWREQVDQTDWRLLNPVDRSRLDRLIPATSYPSRSILINRMVNHRPTIATIIAEDAEVPPSRPQMILNEELLGNCKIGKKYQWNERDQKQLLELQQGNLAPATKMAIENYFFGTIGDLVPAIYDKSMRLAMEIALSGSTDFTDPISKAKFKISYSTTSGHIATALTGADLWSAPTTATPLAGLEAHAEVVYNTLGKFPDNISMHRAQLRQVAATNEAKIAWLTRTGGSGTTSQDLTGVFLSDMQVKELISERINPNTGAEVIINDAKYSEELANGTISDKFFLAVGANTGYYQFGWDGYIERGFVPTIENRLASGIYVVNGQKIDDVPHRYWTTAVANFVPVVRDPRYIAARKVA
jgi:hypothetical protein